MVGIEYGGAVPPFNVISHHKLFFQGKIKILQARWQTGLVDIVKYLCYHRQILSNSFLFFAEIWS